jgi:hypothetical protein
MKPSMISKIAFLSFSIFLASYAFAANKGSLHVISPVDVSGKKLPAGDYTVVWEGSGDSVELKIMNGRKLMATAPAKLVTLAKPSSDDSILVNTNDGVRRLWQIRFSGKTLVLEIVGVSGIAPDQKELQPSTTPDQKRSLAVDPDRRPPV